MPFRLHRELPGPEPLLRDLDDPPSPHSPPTLTDSEPKTFFHRDRLDQFHLHLGVVTRQHHLGALRQVNHTGHVGGTEVELRTVVVEERRVPATLVLGQDVHLRVELSVRGVGARLDDDLAALHILALDAAKHDVELYTVQIEDNTLVAPRDGRIEYRIANIGEVLPAGGHVFAMLDTSNVYMDIYLPTEQAGKVRYGADARVVLDAYPNIAIPAKVNFIATQAQFTPKTVETQSERDKLMFRIRVQIDPELLRARAERVRSGLPGIGYVKTDPAVEWPARLQRLPPQ